ncbi:hypothetical protein [Leptolyngbya sp. 7M]|uniref:hypothetical protein n=1 Tax=Leptolyngbya sp. 7M TaxID=2812896 RepID=UPI00056340E2|nr:hypothetical protein [Leptolyngbya sp. 7M]QYO62595.1 hypothetical protein JVX88_21365 [Leptolyngbya sp. 7M]
MRAVALLVLVVFPGFGFTAVSTYWLWRDWAALTASHQRYMQVATANPTQTDLMIAAAAENRHRINCFAEGVGVLLGSVVWAIGIHGLCTMPRRS